MVTLEQVEQLREHANVTYDEARIALENADGDVLQALIDLERQGKVTPPEGGGKYTSTPLLTQDNPKKEEQSGKRYDQHGGSDRESSAFRQSMRRFFHWCGEVIHKGNINFLIVERNGEHVMKIPVTILVLLLFLAFWVVLPLMIIGLFFSFRYSFHGPDLGCDKVNNAMNSVARAAEDIKNDMKN